MKRFLLNLVCLLVPSKKMRKKVREQLGGRHISEKKLVKRYNKKISELKNKTQIKVAFLVQENSKWNCESLYKKMECSSLFEPIVLLTAIKGREDIDIDENYQFFKNLGYNVDYAYDKKTKKYSNLKDFNIDIIFYQQPYISSDVQYPSYTSEFALCYYIPYSVTVNMELFLSAKNFFSQLHKFFLLNEDVKAEYENIIKLKNGFVTGHPKLEVYFENKPISKDDKYTIIYAPHHSFEKIGLKFATFEWNGLEILEFAKRHPEIRWIFKPHPRFAYALTKNAIMSKEEVDEYYRMWKTIGSIYDKGDYFDLFKSSDCMITDCASFTAEYLPTQNPVIQLENNNAMKYDVVMELASRHYYKVRSVEKLNDALNMLVIKKEDPLKEERLKDIKKLNIENASDNIISYIESLLEK